HPGAAVPERPAPAGRGRRAAAADLAGETVAYRAPNGSASGRHSHRADPDQQAGRGPATGPGRARRGIGPAAEPGYEAPGPGYDAAGGDYDTGPGYDTEPPRRGRDAAPRGRGIGPLRFRRDHGPAGGRDDYPGGRRVPGGRATPADGPGDVPGGETAAE